MNPKTFVACAIILLAAPAFAAPPPNDSFALATAIGGPAGIATGANAEATTEISEPSLGADYGRTIWYRWTAPYSAAVRFRLVNAGVDFAISAYRGNAVNALTPIAAENSGGSPDNAAIFTADAGATYEIAIGSFAGVTGAVEIEWTYAAPANDNFATPLDVTGIRIAPAIINVGATTEVDEPADFAGVPVARTVWYSWTAPHGGVLLLSTEGSDFDTTLFFSTNSALSLGFDDGNDEDPGVTDGHSNIELDVDAGETFRIAVGGKPSGGGLPQAGRVQLNLDFRPADTVSFFTDSLTVSESVGQVSIPVTRSGPNGVEVEYDVFIVSPDGSGVEQKHGLAGDVTTDTITFEIPDNTVYDGPRDYRVYLSFDEPGVRPGAVTELTLHVLDDESFAPVGRNYLGFFADAAHDPAHAGPVAIALNRAGGFTIKSAPGGKTLRSKGHVSATGAATAVLVRTGGTPLTVNFQVPPGDARMAGSAGDATFDSPLTAVRSLRRAELAGAVPAPGRYTGYTRDQAGAVGGDGALFGELDKTGRWKFHGLTIDGLRFAARSAQGVSHEVAFFAQPYGPGGGYIAGVLTRGAIDSAFASTCSAVRVAPQGFDVPLAVRLAGYVAPAPGTLPGTGFNENAGAATMRIFSADALLATQSLQLMPDGSAALVAPLNVTSFSMRGDFSAGRAAGTIRLPGGPPAGVKWKSAIYTGPGLPNNDSIFAGLAVDDAQTLTLEITPN